MFVNLTMVIVISSLLSYFLMIKDKGDWIGKIIKLFRLNKNFAE